LELDRGKNMKNLNKQLIRNIADTDKRVIFSIIVNSLEEIFNVSNAYISTSTRFIEDLGAESLDMVEILTSLQDIFHIEIKEADLFKMLTVGDVVDYIGDYLEKEC
jgi:acyl carrier protein